MPSAVEFFGQVFDISTVTFEEEGEGETARHITKGMTLAVGGKFVHPWFGEIDLSDQVLNEMKRNHDKKVLGTDVAIDERHDRGRALGWIKPGSLKRTKVKLQGKEYATLLGDISWTPDGRKLLEDKTYKYFSPEFGTYTEPDGKTKHENVLTGGALTNRPFLKMIPSVKFEEGSATDVLVLDEGTEDDTLWELDDGTKEVPSFSSKFKKIDKPVTKDDEDAVTLAELLAKAKTLGLDVKDEDGLLVALEQMTTVVKSDEATRVKLKEAGIQFDEKTPTSDVVVSTLTTFAQNMATITSNMAAISAKSLEAEANNAAKKLLDDHKILPVQLSEMAKLYIKDQAMFESLTKTMPTMTVVQFGEIGGPGATVTPGENTEDLREFQDPAKAEERATKYLEETIKLTPKSKQGPTTFDPNQWRNGRHAEARR